MYRPVPQFPHNTYKKVMSQRYSNHTRRHQAWETQQNFVNRNSNHLGEIFYHDQGNLRQSNFQTPYTPVKHEKLPEDYKNLNKDHVQIESTDSQKDKLQPITFESEEKDNSVNFNEKTNNYEEQVELKNTSLKEQIDQEICSTLCPKNFLHGYEDSNPVQLKIIINNTVQCVDNGKDIIIDMGKIVRSANDISLKNNSSQLDCKNHSLQNPNLEKFKKKQHCEIKKDNNHTSKCAKSPVKLNCNLSKSVLQENSKKETIKHKISHIEEQIFKRKNVKSNSNSAVTFLVSSNTKEEGSDDDFVFKKRRKRIRKLDSSEEDESNNIQSKSETLQYRNHVETRKMNRRIKWRELFGDSSGEEDVCIAEKKKKKHEECSKQETIHTYKNHHNDITKSVTESTHLPLTISKSLPKKKHSSKILIHQPSVNSVIFEEAATTPLEIHQIERKSLKPITVPINCTETALLCPGPQIQNDTIIVKQTKYYQTTQTDPTLIDLTKDSPTKIIESDEINTERKENVRIIPKTLAIDFLNKQTKIPTILKHVDTPISELENILVTTRETNEDTSITLYKSEENNTERNADVQAVSATITMASLIKNCNLLQHQVTDITKQPNLVTFPHKIVSSSHQQETSVRNYFIVPDALPPILQKTIPQPMLNDSGTGILNDYDRIRIVEVLFRHVYFLGHLCFAQKSYMDQLCNRNFCRGYFKVELHLFEQEKQRRLEMQSIQLGHDLAKLNIRVYHNLDQAVLVIIDNLINIMQDKDMPRKVTRQMVYMLLWELLKMPQQIFSKVTLFKILFRHCRAVAQKIIGRSYDPFTPEMRNTLEKQVHAYLQICRNQQRCNMQLVNINVSNAIQSSSTMPKVTETSHSNGKNVPTLFDYPSTQLQGLNQNTRFVQNTVVNNLGFVPVHLSNQNRLVLKTPKNSPQETLVQSKQESPSTPKSSSNDSSNDISYNLQVPSRPSPLIDKNVPKETSEPDPETPTDTETNIKLENKELDIKDNLIVNDVNYGHYQNIEDPRSSVAAVKEEIETIDLTWIDDINEEELKRDLDVCMSIKQEENKSDEQSENNKNEECTYTAVRVRNICICGEIAKYKCICEEGNYCGRECQLQDWESHKKFCL
ncbi:hypothetical protein ABEB36_009708 [Hypothenemus hampei]|uniref:MYND-type domain-containing protein n=1 Tax=Hypothenemus hampei TaxID=57062 RepID=A0ABD1EH63_HYPHA